MINTIIAGSSYEVFKGDNYEVTLLLSSIKLILGMHTQGVTVVILCDCLSVCVSVCWLP